MRCARSAAVAFLAAVTLLLTGCEANLAVGIRLWDERTMSMRVDLSVPQDHEATTDDLCTLLTPMGRKLEPYQVDGRRGCRAAGPVPTSFITGMSPDNELAETDGKLRLHLTNFEDALLADAPDDFHLTDIDGAGVTTVSVTFPGKILEHSGSSTVEGRTVSWSDPKDFDAGLTAVSTMPNRLLMPSLMAAGGFLAAAAVVGAYFMFRPKQSVLEQQYGNPH